MDNKTRILTATAGAAALAGLAAAAKALNDGRLSGLRPSSGPTVVRLGFEPDEWVVRVDGVDEARARYGTKKEALRDARALARDQAPSRLVVLRQDGSVQTEHTYDDGEEAAS